MPNRAGIPTVIAGTRFRSRLEARWAHLLTEIGWQWEYEPFDLDGYIPDFLIFGDAPLLIEVKPLVSPPEYADLAGHLPRHQIADTLVVGCTPLLTGASTAWPAAWPAAGVLRENPPPIDTCSSLDGIGHAMWARCGSCDSPAVFHEYMSWRCRPCGHYDGDRYLDYPQTHHIGDVWAEARNATQWLPA